MRRRRRTLSSCNVRAGSLFVATLVRAAAAVASGDGPARRRPASAPPSASSNGCSSRARARGRPSRPSAWSSRPRRWPGSGSWRTGSSPSTTCWARSPASPSPWPQPARRRHRRLIRDPPEAAEVGPSRSVPALRAAVGCLHRRARSSSRSRDVVPAAWARGSRRPRSSSARGSRHERDRRSSSRGTARRRTTEWRGRIDPAAVAMGGATSDSARSPSGRDLVAAP